MPNGPLLGTRHARRAPKRNGTFSWKALWNRTEPPRRMPTSDSEPTTWVFTKRLGLGRVAQPNESRLSCGAKLKHSQMEFYHTARRTFAGLIEEGRRQLQAHVRLRTTSHSSGPSLSLSRRSTHRPAPAAEL